MPLQKQQRCGAADASSSGGISSLKHHHRAKGVTGSISGGVSQKQQRAAGEVGLVDEEMTPQKLRQGGEKAGTVSRGEGVVRRRTPRLPRTTIKHTQAGEKNTKNKTSLNSDVSLLDIDNAAHASASLDGPSMDAPSHSTTVQDCKAVAKQFAKEKASTSSIVKILSKYSAKKVGLSGKMLVKEKMSEGSIGEIPQKHQTKQEIRPSITGDKLSKRNKPSPRTSSQYTSGQQRRTIGSSQCLNAKAGYSLVGKSTVNDCKESAADKSTIVYVKDGEDFQEADDEIQRKEYAADKNTIVHVKDGKDLQEADDEIQREESAADKNTIVHDEDSEDLQEADNGIQRLNEFGLGEDISSDEFLEYFEQLPDQPDVDTYAKLDDENLAPLYKRHARYRIRYLKLSTAESMAKLNAELKQHDAMDLLEEDLSGKLLAKMGYLKDYEKDGTLDWFFHPDLCRLEALEDYQRLVPRNHDACGYSDDCWYKYHKLFYSYESEQEYTKYCKELLEKLKWMKDYVLIEKTSRRWEMISTRVAYQAIKIATSFSKITGELAYTGYYECVKKLQFDAFWLDGLDCIYFEVWLRVTKQMKSFRDALEEVYKLKMYPLRQERMKYALEIDCSEMEDEFCTCTASVTSEVTEDQARDLIAEAVKKIDGPKLYEHYIQKKIAIAQAIGLIPTVKHASAESGQQINA